MKIEVGDKLTGKWLDNNQIIEEMAVSNDFLQKLYKNIENNKVEILKIERPNWEIVEEKKELLTEEERDYLKFILNIETFQVKYVEKKQSTSDEIKLTLFFGDGIADGHYRYVKSSYFKNLKEGKRYNLKELRIGGINYEFCKSRINTL